MKYYISFLAIVLFYNLGSASSIMDAPDVSLGHIIKKTRKMYESGVDRRIIADYINGQVDRRIKSTNNIEIFEDPLNWLRLLKERKLNTDLESGSYEDTANVAWSTGLGNCEENSTLVYYILKKAGVKEHVRILRSAKHSFTVWDVHPSATIGKPSSWGENAIVVDPWLGENLSKEEVEINRWFMNNDPDAEINDHTIYADADADNWSRINSLYNRENNIIPEPSESSQDDTDCFIATAVYGNPNAPNIEILRTYRDKVLKNNLLGAFFVKTYETFGPVFAFFIRENEERKKWVKENMVEPAVFVASKQI